MGGGERGYVGPSLVSRERLFHSLVQRDSQHPFLHLLSLLLLHHTHTHTHTERVEIMVDSFTRHMGV